MFITRLNVKTGWETYLSDAAANRHYDLEIRFSTPQQEQVIRSVISSIPGVQQIESWNLNPAAMARPDSLDIVRTYPDGGHGSFTLRSTPAGSHLLETPMIAGRWIEASDQGSVILNQLAAGLFPTAKVGDTIQLAINGQSSSFHLVGIVRQILTPATAYVSPADFARSTGQPIQLTNAVRIVLMRHDAPSISAATGAVDTVLAARNIRTNVVISESMLEGATNGHVYIFIVALILIAFVMGVVGVLGLMSSLGTSVIERSREFGIMRAIGAKPHTILRIVTGEGLITGLMSWIIAIPLSLPVSAGVGCLIGMLSFRSPLPLVLSPLAVFLWLVVILIGSISASAYPAHKAARLTIRETLSYI